MRQSSSRLSIIVVVISVTLVAITNNADGAVASTPPAAGWTAVANVNDKSIQQVGQFAVRVYTLTTHEIHLKYVNVVSGQMQPYNGGYNYRLVVTVSVIPSWRTALFDAYVWGIPGTTNWRLRSFTPK